MRRLARNSFATNLLNSLTANIAVMNSQGDIIAVNSAWKRFAQKNHCADKNFYIGANYLTVYENALQADHDKAAEKAFHGFQEVVLGKKDGFEFEYPCNSPGKKRWFICRVTRLEHEGEFYIVALHNNITTQKETEQALEKSSERFRKLTRDLPDAIYTLDMTKRRVTYFNHDRFLGYTRNELMSPGSILQKVHPDDSPIIVAHWQKVMQGIEASSIEYRVCNKAGEWEWLESRETIIAKAEDGSPKEIMVILTLITERKRTEEKIQYQFKLLENVNDAIFCTDENFLITYWNRAAERIFGWRSEEVIGRSTMDVLKAEFSPEQRAESIRMLTEIGQWKGEIIQHSRSGEPLVFEANVMSMKDYRGQTIYVAANRDITQRKRAEEELRHAKESIEATNHELQEALTREQILARTDGMTGVNNARHFFDIAKQEFMVAKRYGQPLSIIIFDLDHFKKINDTFGHQVGDKVLKHVAQIAIEHVREADTFARYGGEEFVALLPNSNAMESSVVAERIRQSISECCTNTDLGDVTVTVSAGIAESLSNVDDIENIIRRADQALYKAKEAGRNCVRIYSPTD